MPSTGMVHLDSAMGNLSVKTSAAKTETKTAPKKRLAAPKKMNTKARDYKPGSGLSSRKLSLPRAKGSAPLNKGKKA